MVPGDLGLHGTLVNLSTVLHYNQGPGANDIKFLWPYFTDEPELEFLPPASLSILG